MPSVPSPAVSSLPGRWLLPLLADFTRVASEERAGVSADLLRLGPAAPTLCEGWTARDLAAHLVTREHRPDALAGQWLPGLADRTDRVMRGAADRPFEELVDQLRAGPPIWHPTRLGVVDGLWNAAEMFVHHEDLLRAQPGWEPRQLTSDEERVLWETARRLSGWLLRQATVGVVLVAAGHAGARVRRGSPVVTVHGAPGEVLLWVFGRRDHAQVDLDGMDAAVASLRSVHSGL